MLLVHSQVHLLYTKHSIKQQSPLVNLISLKTHLPYQVLDGYIYDYLTSSYFDPYVTTVGLYDEAQNLLAVGKLSQPLPTSRTTDTTIFINIDRT
jgi:hypothetical protein